MIIIKAIQMLLIVVFGIIYLPLNMLYMKLSDKYRHLKHEGKSEYILIGAIMFPIWLIATIFSVPYEFLVEHTH